MSRAKYPISREFYPLARIKAPLNKGVLRATRVLLGIPRFLFTDPELSVRLLRVPTGDGAHVEVYLMEPTGLPEPAPCLVNFHGGGFVYEGSPSHVRIAMTYAKDAHCKVAYVRYRLAPEHPFPAPQEDCYATLAWLHAHAEGLGIDRQRMAVGGDSAGGTLSAVCCLMAREREAPMRPLFQMLVYPWLDGRNNSASNQRFTDTPLWNSTLSHRAMPLINPDPSATPLAYRSPAQAESHIGLPPAYIETAEFDCLHDDGALYARLLREAGVSAELHETRGTMHGYDTVVWAPTTRRMIAERCAYMRRMFGGAPAKA